MKSKPFSRRLLSVLLVVALLAVALPLTTLAAQQQIYYNLVSVTVEEGSSFTSARWNVVNQITCPRCGTTDSFVYRIQELWNESGERNRYNYFLL